VPAVLDIRRIRTDPAEVKAALARRGIDVADVDRVHDLDTRRRELAAERDEVRNRVKTVSKEVGRLRGAGDVAAAEAQQAESRALGERERALADDEAAVAEEIRQLLLRIPNTPHPDAPDGSSDADNPVVKVVGFDPESYQPHQRVPHWETGAALGILDNERAVKITGSMFVMLRKQGATLSRALCQLALDNNADAFEEIRPPSLVSSATLTATGQLPKFADDAYAIERDDLWCIPTAEVPLTSIASGELLDEADLPQRFMAYSPCYRREAGSAGRDTRGMLRAHEFDKVEILAYATPAEAPALLEELVARAEATIASLGLAYRIIEICTGDLGQSHHRSFDIEVYAPGCDQWLEVSSISWFSDYQARRADIRYRPTPGHDGARRPNEFIHTLNGSALAVPRVWAAIVETHRNPDGTVTVPEPLLPYLRGATVIS
jgi:seryl-tRNA synthetase